MINFQGSAYMKLYLTFIAPANPCNSSILTGVLCIFTAMENAWLVYLIQPINYSCEKNQS